MKLKIGRNTYEIRKGDKFLDNGAIVQLITQSKEVSSWGYQPNPVLSKKAIGEIQKLQFKEYPYLSDRPNEAIVKEVI